MVVLTRLRAHLFRFYHQRHQDRYRAPVIVTLQLRIEIRFMYTEALMEHPEMLAFLHLIFQLWSGMR